MAEEFDHLACPMCGSELVYSEGTHDLGCRNNPKLNVNINKINKTYLHEVVESYGECSVNEHNNKLYDFSEPTVREQGYKSYRMCDISKSNSSSNYQQNICELTGNIQSYKNEGKDEQKRTVCVFGISFTESASKGTLWSIRIIDGQTNYAALMRLMQNIEGRVRAKEPLAANVPNQSKKIERSNVSKLAFRYNLEIEDLFSIKYSTETIERLAMFYNLTQKEIRHIKQSDILEE